MNETVLRDGRPVTGIGQAEVIAAPAAASSPFTLAFVGGAATAATGWLLEEVWSAVRGPKRKRRRRQ